MTIYTHVGIWPLCFDELFQIPNGFWKPSLGSREMGTIYYCYSPHEFPMGFGHHKWPQKSHCYPEWRSHEGYNEAFKVTSGVQNPLGTSEDCNNDIVSFPTKRLLRLKTIVQWRIVNWLMWFDIFFLPKKLKKKIVKSHQPVYNAAL